MPHTNIEFKARCHNMAEALAKLKKLNARFVGIDRQIDTYFNVPNGRLKLREGNIENALIWYERPNKPGSKQSDIILYEHQPSDELKAILLKTFAVKTIIDKTRHIYFIDNVKFHFDEVVGLGSFLEVEAIDSNGSIPVEKLEQQCNHYAAFFGILTADYIAVSYSDM